MIGLTGKKIPRQAIIGDAGVALIHSRVAAMGYVWHERKTDAGIDGEIELRDLVTEEARNHVVFVQSKASERPFPSETEVGFHFPVRERDLNYWLSGNAPVILVCSHPSLNEAWWVHINEYFSDSARREARIVVFDKAAQPFDASAANAIARLAAPAGSGVYLGAEPRQEQIVSNLLPLHHPPAIHRVPTNADGARALSDSLRESRVFRRDWVLRGDHLYSFAPFTEGAWSRWLDGPEMRTSTDEWLHSDDRDEQRLVVELLNRALRDSFHRELGWHPRHNFLYFRATDDLSPRKEMGRGTRERTVFKAYAKKKDASLIAYYRHDAVKISWIADDDGWCAQLLPTYHFTQDGREDYHWAEDQLSGIKRMEHAYAVEGSVRMWATFLRGDKPKLDAPPRLLTFGDLLAFGAAAGIDDSGWDQTSRLDVDQPETGAEVELDPTTHVFESDGDVDDSDDQGGLW